MIRHQLPIDIDPNKIAEFSRKWKITEFALFGSVLRDDFGPDSDIDVLLTYDSHAHWSLFDLLTIEDELADMFGRKVDVITRPGIERSRNTRRRQEILSTAEVIHAA